MLASLAPILSTPITIWAVSILIVLWAAWSGAFLWRSCSNLTRAVGDITRLIDTTEDQLGFAAGFEELSAKVGQDAAVGAAWRGYCETLLIPTEPGRPIRATAGSGDWFSIDLLRRTGTDLRYHAALPNLLVGAGLLFTFLGLAAALASAGGIVQAQEAADRNAALQTLLDAASFKFVTSIVGLFCSIGYALFRKSRLKRVERALDRFVAVVVKRTPLVTPAFLQHEANEVLHRQTMQLETFSSELAVNLGTAVDNAFDRRLGEHIGPLAEALERLSRDMGSRNEDAMQRMIEAFLGRLEGGAGTQMQGVAEILGELGRGLGGLRAGLDTAADRMSDAAKAMSRRMGEEAATGAARLTSQLDAVVETLRQLADSSRSAGASAVELLGERLSAATAALEATARGIAQTLEQAAASTGNSLNSGAEEAVQRIAAGIEAMRVELQAMLVEMRRALSDTVSTIQTGTAAGAQAIETSLASAGNELTAAMQGVAGSLREAGTAAGGALVRGGEDAAQKLGVAGASLHQPAQLLGERAGALSRALEEAGDQLERLEQASAGFAGPLQTVGARLAETVGGLRDATQPVAETARRLGVAADLLAGGATRLNEAVIRAGELARQMDGATGRFAGIDTALAKTVGQLQTALIAYTSQIGRFVSETDSNLAEAASKLQSLVKGLDETVGDLVDRLPPPQRR